MTRPVCVTGMHRAGTSMVAKAAQELGLYLGHPDDLVPAAPDNPDGFFEHAGLVGASDALFQQLGGGWDCPPTFTPADLDRRGVATARELARPVVEELARHGAWAWKDPRAAPVMPFWLDLVPDLGIVVCLRNPLEVAASLRARNGTSLALGLRLWFQHLDAVVASDAPRLVTHYDAWFHRPDDEVARLADFAGVAVDPVRGAAAASVPARHLRHIRFDAPALRDAGVHPELRRLYERLTAEADWPDGATGPAVDDPAPAEPSSFEPALGQVKPSVVDVGVARFEVHKRNGRVAQLERRNAELDRRRPEPATAHWSAVPTPEDVQASVYDLQLTVAELAARVGTGEGTPTADGTAAADVAYARMIRAVRSEVRLLPPDVDLLVIGDGEPALIDLHGRRARHFPAGPSPALPGPHPATGAEAAAHLVALQALGATHLIVPSTAAWWLAAYPELTERLSTASTVVARPAEDTTIFRLDVPVDPDRLPTVDRALDVARRRLGDDATVLDWTAAGLGLVSAFRPPLDATTLPYLDATIDIVVVDEGDPNRLADGLRVASGGVLVGGPSGWTWSWTGPPPLVSAEVVVVAAPLGRPAAYLDLLLSTLPARLGGAVTVVVPPDTEATWRDAARDRVTISTGLVGATVREVATRSSADHVALVDGSAIPLAGWLPALLAPFARGERVGLVAGRRRMPAGAPVLAAHAVHGPGLRPAPGVDGDTLTRPIDIPVPGVTATRRDVLSSGLDDRYSTLDFALADLSWALAADGLECLVQPEAETVDLGLDGPSPEALALDRARFDDAWATP